MALHPHDQTGAYGATPAPAVDVVIQWKGRRRTVRALIDTGASVTMLRRSDRYFLQLPKVGDAENIGGLGGSARSEPVVVNITFEGSPQDPVARAKPALERRLGTRIESGEETEVDLARADRDAQVTGKADSAAVADDQSGAEQPRARGVRVGDAEEQEIGL